MSGSENFRRFSIQFFGALILLLSIFESAAPASVNLLTSGSVVNVSSADTRCCASGFSNCSAVALPPLCAFDGDGSTVWTLGSNQATVTLMLRLNDSAILDRLEMNFDTAGAIPYALKITAINDNMDTGIQWTTYFNKTCEPDDTYLRKQGPVYYSCFKIGDLPRLNQPWIASLPKGLLSVRDANDQLLWWKTFQRLEVTVATTNDDGIPSNGTELIGITDIRLYGWNPSKVGCNCHPAGVNNISVPCDQTGSCKCRSQQTDSQCTPTIIGVFPNVGPISGGTLFGAVGSFFSLLSEVTIGNVPATIQFQNDSLLLAQTNAASSSDVGHSLPIQLHFNQANIPSSLIIADSEFTYKPDPVVTSITPRRTIQRGGIVQTVIGRNLDNIRSPFINIISTSNYNNNYKLFVTYNYTTPGSYPEDKYGQAKCNMINSTMLTCWTPGLPDNALSTADSFNISIVLDIDSSKNDTICQSTDGMCDMLVAPNPEITTWNQDLDKPIEFEYYNGDRTLQINGNRFTYGSGREDFTGEYTVTVGDVECEIVDMVTNVIIFKPPEPKSIDTSKKQTVVVSIGYYSFTVGSMVYCLSWIDCSGHRSALIGGLVGGIGGAIVLAILLFLFIRYWKKHRGSSRHYRQASETFDYQVIAQHFEEDIAKYCVDFDRVHLEDELGKGNFGKVYKGTLVNQDGEKVLVAIKTLRGGALTFDEKLEFLQEALIMADFCHSNVLSLTAISIDGNMPYVILPIMEHGDLRGFVSNTGNSFTHGDIVSFSLQVAEGMEYLAGRNFIHRDLAARNCMINKSLLVKVADFGLARDIFEKDYYRPTDSQRPLPVKWMAIESLKSGHFTEKSDVWSYGVLVWELLTRGRKPYSDVDNRFISRYLEEGKRLERPPSTPDFMHDLMQDCWLKDPKIRPTFKEIVNLLKSILSLNQSAESPTRNLANNDVHTAAEARRSYLQLTNE